MDYEIINCPACRHQVKIPEARLGSPVQCPECKTPFLVPTRDEFGEAGTPQIIDEVSSGNRTSSAKSSPNPVMIPGVALIVVALIGLFAQLAVLVQLQGDPERFQKEFQKAVENKNKDLAEKEKQEMREVIENVTQNLPLILQIAAGSWLIVLLSGIAMLKRRFYWLTILGNILAMINIVNGCCLLGIPVGIWSLILLFNREVRETFS
jgi:hypothetical protein